MGVCNTQINFKDPRELTRLARLNQQLQEELEPFIKLKIDILNSSIPRVVLWEDKKAEITYPQEIMDKVKEVDKLIEERIDSFCKRHDLARPS